MSQMGFFVWLLKDLGIGSLGFIIDNVMKFLVSFLEYRVYEVCEMVVRIILDMYRQYQVFILEYFFLDDSNICKNIFYKIIFEGFVKIDGRFIDVEMRVWRKVVIEEVEK